MHLRERALEPLGQAFERLDPSRLPGDGTTADGNGDQGEDERDAQEHEQPDDHRARRSPRGVALTPGG